MCGRAGNGSYTVVLATKPSEAVAVTISKPTGQDADLNLPSSPTLTLNFATDTWNNPQTVTVTATADTDMSDGTAFSCIMRRATTMTICRRP